VTSAIIAQLKKDGEAIVEADRVSGKKPKPAPVTT